MNDTIHDLLRCFVSRPSPTRIGGWMNELIDQCENAQPHTDWADLRSIDYEAEFPRLLDWFQAEFQSLSESDKAAGCHLYLSNPVRFLDRREQDACMEAMKSAANRLDESCHTGESEALEPFSQVQARTFAASRTTTDIGLSYYSGYERSQAPDAWLDDEHLISETDAGSEVLDHLYQVSYRTRNPLTPVEGSLGNDTDAEWAIGLGYAILISRSIAEALDLEQFGGRPESIAFAAGWEVGDIEFVGELTTHAGFTPGTWGSIIG